MFHLNNIPVRGIVRYSRSTDKTVLLGLPSMFRFVQSRDTSSEIASAFVLSSAAAHDLRRSMVTSGG